MHTNIVKLRQIQFFKPPPLPSSCNHWRGCLWQPYTHTSWGQIGYWHPGKECPKGSILVPTSEACMPSGLGPPGYSFVLQDRHTSAEAFRDQFLPLADHNPKPVKYPVAHSMHYKCQREHLQQDLVHSSNITDRPSFFIPVGPGKIPSKHSWKVNQSRSFRRSISGYSTARELDRRMPLQQGLLWI